MAKRPETKRVDAAAKAAARNLPPIPAEGGAYVVGPDGKLIKEPLETASKED